MTRTASGRDVLEQGKMVGEKAGKVWEFKKAQALLLPLEHGMSLAETARVIGMTANSTCRLRCRFARELRGEEMPRRRGGRRHSNLSEEGEKAFLAPFFEQAKVGGILTVAPIKTALETQLGRKVGLSSVYKLLARHNWRKLAPDKQHPKANVAAQDDFKKTARNNCS